MRVVFCIYDFREGNLPLQPWLTIRNIACGLAGKGHEVVIVTDTAHPADIEGLTVRTVSSLRAIGSAGVSAELSRFRPDTLVFLPTPLNIVTASWLDRLRCRRIGFASYPFYNGREVLTALRRIGMSDTRDFLRHLLLPRPLWVRVLRHRVHAMIVQSESTAARLRELGSARPEIFCVPPGIDLDDWPAGESGAGDTGAPVRLLYMGAASAIRGFHVLLDALAMVSDIRVTLKVLARGAEGSTLQAIEAEVRRRGLSGRVSIAGGWIERARLIAEIHAADAVVQPFVLVPSELPVTVMEVIACGTPVIGSDIDGLPSTIGSAGKVFRQGSAADLAGLIRESAVSESMRVEWRNGCLSRRAEMQDWPAVVGRWESILSGHA